MTDTNNGASESTERSPYDRLRAAARQAMIAAFPAYKKALESDKLWSVEQSFIMDAMAEKGKCNLPHRISDERLAAEIGEDANVIFKDLSASMIAFYERKLKETKPR